MKLRILALAITLGWTASSFAQSMNIDFDLSNEDPMYCFLPTSDYPAAGSAGHWNSVNNLFGQMINPPGGLRDLTGDTTSAVVDYDAESATICFFFSDKIVDIDHRALLSDAWYLGYLGKWPDTFTFQFTGLQDGAYEVITYGFDDLDASSINSVDVIGSPEGPQLVGGDYWIGSMVEGVTHVVHTVDVTDGTITIPVTKIAGVCNLLNGFQLRLIPDCPADLDGDNTVGITDFLDLLAQWGTDPGGPPDFDGDGNVGVVDFLALLANWGPCPT